MNWKKGAAQLLCSVKKSTDKFDNDAYHRTTIHNLPDDILLEIFSYLSIDYCQTASLVCRRWDVLAFGTNRVQLNVTILNKNRSMEKSYRRSLSRSKRPYRHLKLVDCRHSLVLQVLAKFTSNLNSLTLSCDVKLEHLAEIVQLCPNIRSLDVKFSNFEQISQKTVVLRPLVNLEILKVDIGFLNLPGINLSQLAPNVTSLTIVYSEDLAVPAPVLDHYGPRLRELILLVNLCLKRGTKIHNVWQTKFPLLQRFECHLGRHDGSDDPYDPITDMDRILEHCEHLHVAKFYRVTYLPRLTLKLSQLCTNLRELSLGMIRVTAQHFVHICQLQQLKYLHIEESTVETPNFQCYQVLDSLTELSLHAANFDNSYQFNDFVRHAFPALSSFRVHNCRDSYYIAEVKFWGLQLLEQLSVREIQPICWEFIVNLSSLPLLKTVTLICSNFPEYTLDHVPHVVSTSIQSLSILAELTDDDLCRLVCFFSNLRLLKLRNLTGCTADGIRKAQKLVPECLFEVPAKF
ncbi:uncharacterized protein LOC120431296 [Culex pipiens pallens]|uniref:uncharacterized protein LOC120431296 n=1 Tax=Culex pipiens pallens TaxID=42434 RepID=UPI0022AAEC89|nr:uncharacterized protein LOC120431296 [Culex pipiens pallens]